jgi:RNA polymerase sigma factor (sigma-70 family)
MASIGQSGVIARRLERLFGWGTVSGLSEGQLLARFIGERDESAFEAIVTRHGPMVLGICRRLLDDPGDAEDAFQATFLVLVQKARSLRDRELLGNWLYGVAVRVAHRSRRQRARRHARERSTEMETIAAPDGIDQLGPLRASLDAEVARLPDKFRAPVILCYFEGLTHDEAAQRLRCPVGTVRSRMAKARELLRVRLTRAGITPLQASVRLLQTPPWAPEVSPALLARLTHSASRVAEGQSVAGTVSTSVASLTQGVSRMMSLTKVVAFVPVAVIASALVGVAGLAARQAGDRPAPKPSAAPTAPAPAQTKPWDEAQWDAKLEQMHARLDQSEKQLEQQMDEVGRQRTELAALEAALDEFREAARSRPGAVKKEAPKRDGPRAQADPDQPATKPAPDSVVTTNRLIISHPARSNRLVLYDLVTGSAQTYRPPAGQELQNWWIQDQVLIVASSGRAQTRLAGYVIDRGQWVTQDLGETVSNRNVSGSSRPFAGLMALQLSSPGLRQLAVLDTKRCRWFVQDLRQPAEEWTAVPYTAAGMALYALGRYLYAFSAEAGRWDVLTLERELPTIGQGSAFPKCVVDPNFAPIMGTGSIAVSESGRLHVFLAKTGRWQTIDSE